MKLIRVVSFSLFLLLACCGDSKPEDPQIVGTWELVRMSGQTPDSETTGAEMAWQERISLAPDSTFVKLQIENGLERSAVGRYTLSQNPDGYSLILIYEDDNELIANCTHSLEEHLTIDNDGNMTGSWWACDGPGLFYHKAATFN